MSRAKPIRCQDCRTQLKLSKDINPGQNQVYSEADVVHPKRNAIITLYWCRPCTLAMYPDRRDPLGFAIAE